MDKCTLDECEFNTGRMDSFGGLVLQMFFRGRADVKAGIFYWMMSETAVKTKKTIVVNF